MNFWKSLKLLLIGPVLLALSCILLNYLLDHERIHTEPEEIKDIKFDFIIGEIIRCNFCKFVQFMINKML